MKKIIDFKINGFKAENRIAEVNFSKDNVTVIYGDNGCGKTTFLKTIFLFLSQDETSLKEMGVQSIECSVLIHNEVQKIIVEKNEEGYNWKQFNESCFFDSKSMSLGVERGISTQAMKIEPEIIFSFFSHPRYRDYFSNKSLHLSQRHYLREISEDLSHFLRNRNKRRLSNRTPELDCSEDHLYLQNIKIENIEELLLRKYRQARIATTQKIQKALFETLSVAIITEEKEKTNLPDDFSNRLEESKDRIIEALDDGDDNNFKTEIIEILRNINDDDNLEKILENNLLSRLFMNMIDELEVEKLMLNSINLLIETFNHYLIDNKKLVVNNSEVYVEIEAGKHSVNELSSGERHILTFLTLVLFEAQDRNFLIIDEPEISLNIKWQRELMSLLSKLLPDTQIIVASHSPALAKRNPQFLSELKVWSI